MSEFIRVELAGRNKSKWNRIFGALRNVISAGIRLVIPRGNKDVTDAADDMIKDIADISEGWAKATVEKQELENRKKIAEIESMFEEVKTKQVQRKEQELKNELLKLELLEKRVAAAAKF